MNTETILRGGTKINSPVAFRVQQGEKVQGLTGVVITTKPGKVKALKTLTLDVDNPVQVPAGAIIYILHYGGEGYCLFWFNGKTHSEELDVLAIGTHGTWEVLTLPETVWWVKIKNSKGQIGWTTETEHFDNMDACG